MGYKSDFVLAIHGNDDTKALAKMLVWLREKQEAELTTDKDGWYCYLMSQCFDEESSAPHDNYLIFTDTSVKLYAFDAIKNTITDKAEELGLKWEYCCVGEDTDDNTHDSSGGCDPQYFISRKIERY